MHWKRTLRYWTTTQDYSGTVRKELWSRRLQLPRNCQFRDPSGPELALAVAGERLVSPKHCWRPSGKSNFLFQTRKSGSAEVRNDSPINPNYFLPDDKLRARHHQLPWCSERYEDFSGSRWFPWEILNTKKKIEKICVWRHETKEITTHEIPNKNFFVHTLLSCIFGTHLKICQNLFAIFWHFSSIISSIKFSKIDENVSLCNFFSYFFSQFQNFCLCSVPGMTVAWMSWKMNGKQMFGVFILGFV